MAGATGHSPMASVCRPGDTAHVEFGDADGFVWSYPSRVVWTAPQRLALTLPGDPRWLPLLQPGRRLSVTLLDPGGTAATAMMVVQEITAEFPPVLVVGPPVSRRGTQPLQASGKRGTQPLPAGLLPPIA